MDNLMAYIELNIDPIKLDVLYNVVVNKTFKRGKQGAPWKGRNEKAPMLMEKLVECCNPHEERC